MNKNFGVVGYPLGHSMSPFIHKELFLLKNLHAVYKKFEVEPKDLEKSFKKELVNLSGFNITIPHKAKIIDFLENLYATILDCGAVNTVSSINSRYYESNTDGFVSCGYNGG